MNEADTGQNEGSGSPFFAGELCQKNDFKTKNIERLCFASEM